jgi:ribosome-associated protein
MSLQVTDSISLNDSELQFAFIRSSGPGGQNVNKVATGVQLRFDALRSPALPEDVRQRLLTLAGSRLTGEGVIQIDARRYRTQERNREDAVQRLVDLICQAAQAPRPRKKTRPTQAATLRRLEKKKRRSQVKRLRRWDAQE